MIIYNANDNKLTQLQKTQLNKLTSRLNIDLHIYI